MNIWVFDKKKAWKRGASFSLVLSVSRGKGGEGGII